MPAAPWGDLVFLRYWFEQRGEKKLEETSSHSQILKNKTLKVFGSDESARLASKDASTRGAQFRF